MSSLWTGCPPRLVRPTPSRQVPPPSTVCRGTLSSVSPACNRRPPRLTFLSTGTPDHWDFHLPVLRLDLPLFLCRGYRPKGAGRTDSDWESTVSSPCPRERGWATVGRSPRDPARGDGKTTLVHTAGVVSTDPGSRHVLDGPTYVGLPLRPPSAGRPGAESLGGVGPDVPFLLFNLSSSCITSEHGGPLSDGRVYLTVINSFLGPSVLFSPTLYAE